MKPIAIESNLKKVPVRKKSFEKLSCANNFMADKNIIKHIAKVEALIL